MVEVLKSKSHPTQKDQIKMCSKIKGAYNRTYSLAPRHPEKTYLGDHRPPNVGCRCLNGTSNIGAIAIAIAIMPMFERDNVWLMFERAVPMFKHWQPTFKQALLMNMYDYTLPKINGKN